MQRCDLDYGNEVTTHAIFYMWTQDKDDNVQPSISTDVIKPLLNELQKRSVHIGYDSKLKRMRDNNYKKFVKHMLNK